MHSTTISNKILAVQFSTEEGIFTITDKRINKSYHQNPLSSNVVFTDANTLSVSSFTVNGWDFNDNRAVSFNCELENDTVNILLSSNGTMSENYNFPSSFITEKDDYLVWPHSQGLSFMADDADMHLPKWDYECEYPTFSAWGLCMAFFGVTNGESGYMTIIKTPDDAAMKHSFINGMHSSSPNWYPQKGQFGYNRKFQYVFFNEGGHVAQALRYRKYAKEIGHLKTFDEKKKERGPKGAEAIDKLLGSANIWCWRWWAACWHNDADSIINMLREHGIDKVMWSSQLGDRELPEWQIDKINEMGVLSSVYDIYQDVMDPDKFSEIEDVPNPSWPTEAFPHDIGIKKDGGFIQACAVRAKEGTWINCAALCDLVAPDYARTRISDSLTQRDYRARFIDATASQPFRECYSHDHPATRTDSKNARAELLSVVSHENNMVCGSESGIDSLVPVCDYFEGMMSLAHYMVDDAGDNMWTIVDNPPEKVARYQVGEAYRLPLWELVYHDAAVAMWYWGDYSNRFPNLWLKRDLFNVLYGTPPMYMFNQEFFNENQARFTESYNMIAPVIQATAGVAMTDHKFITKDRKVQQTTFANGVKVTVNFSDKEYSDNGKSIKALGYVVEGIEGGIHLPMPPVENFSNTSDISITDNLAKENTEERYYFPPIKPGDAEDDWGTWQIATCDSNHNNTMVPMKEFLSADYLVIETEYTPHTLHFYVSRHRDDTQWEPYLVLETSRRHIIDLSTMPKREIVINQDSFSMGLWNWTPDGYKPHGIYDLGKITAYLTKTQPG